MVFFPGDKVLLGVKTYVLPELVDGVFQLEKGLSCTQNGCLVEYPQLGPLLALDRRGPESIGKQVINRYVVLRWTDDDALKGKVCETHPEAVEVAGRMENLVYGTNPVAGIFQLDLAIEVSTAEERQYQEHA